MLSTDIAQNWRNWLLTDRRRSRVPLPRFEFVDRILQILHLRRHDGRVGKPLFKSDTKIAAVRDKKMASGASYGTEVMNCQEAVWIAGKGQWINVSCWNYMNAKIGFSIGLVHFSWSWKSWFWMHQLIEYSKLPLQFRKFSSNRSITSIWNNEG